MRSRKDQARDAKCSEFSRLRIPIKLRKELTLKIDVGCFLVKWVFLQVQVPFLRGTCVSQNTVGTFTAISISVYGYCSRKIYCTHKTIQLEYLGRGKPSIMAEKWDRKKICFIINILYSTFSKYLNIPIRSSCIVEY